MNLNQHLISKIKEFFPDGKEKRGEWWTLNPFRNDMRPDSFSINLTNGLWNDFADNSKGNIITLIARKKGITTKELWKEYAYLMPRDNKLRHFELGYPSITYQYNTMDGKEVGKVLRFTTPKGKTFRAFSNGKWNKEGFPTPHPLYNCHKLTQYKKILVTEGEKSVEKIQPILGDEYLVTTWPFGAKNYHNADWSMLLKSKEIYLWPDNDDIGIYAMNEVYKTLTSNKSHSLEQKIVKIVDVSKLNLPESWDLGDCDESWTKEKVLEILNSSLESQLISKDIVKEETKCNEISTTYKPHPSLENYVNYVDVLPKFINETNESTVTIDKKGNVIGHSVSTVLLFCIDYFQAGKDLHQSNRIALLAMDGKLRHRKYKQIKEDGVKKIIIIEEPFYLNDNNYSKSVEFYNQSVIDYNVNMLKKKLSYNGSEYKKTKKIFKELAKYFTHDAEMATMVLIHFIVQVKLKLHDRHNEIQLHMAPVFCSMRQKNGKSTFMRKFCSPLYDFYAEKLPEDFSDVRNWKEHCSNYINGSDDINEVKGNVMSIWKGMITSNILHARILGRNLDAVLKHNTSYICTAQTDNLGEVIIDESGNRRFAAILVDSFKDQRFLDEDKEFLKELYLKDSEFVFPNVADKFFNFEYLWQLVDENWINDKNYIQEVDNIITKQEKHLTKSSVEQFFDLYEIEVGNDWIPSAMVFSIYAKECKMPVSITKFSQIVNSRFGEETTMPRTFNKKCQRAYKIQFNSTLHEKLNKEFKNIVP